MAPAFVGAFNAVARRRSPVSSRRSVSTRTAVRMATHIMNDVEISRIPQAVRNNVLVKVSEAEEITSGGLVLTPAAQEQKYYGVVVNCGDGYNYYTTGTRVPMAIQPGDSVLYGKYGIDEVEIDDEMHAFVSQDAVLAKIDGDYKADNVRPIFDSVLIRRDDKSGKLASGLMLAGKAAESPQTGTITALGPGRLMEGGDYEKTPYSVGDRVCVSSSAGTPVKFGGASYVLVRVVEILGKL